MAEKLKSLIQNDQIFFSLIVLLVGIASFALGRASVAQNMPTIVETEPFNSNSTQLLPDSGTNNASLLESVKLNQSTSSKVVLVASRSGTKYHLETCPGAKQIKESNVIRFSSVAEAEAAGYKPAVNCPGLQ